MNYEFNLQEIKNLIEELDISPEEKIEKIKGQIQSRLSHLTGFLNETDYKVIKCYEASLLNEEIPYNLQELLIQRKMWREEINTLQFEISMLG
jgi:DNA-binding transcriptional MerR regulator